MAASRLLFFVRRIGPYHDARFEAVGRRRNLVVVETRPGSSEYPWSTPPGARHYRQEAFHPAADPGEGLRGPDLGREVARVLARHEPAVVACSGWADPEYHAVLHACQRLGIAAIVMSDSTFDDEPRRGWRETMKGFLVRNFSAAVVAGTRSRHYLAGLGFPPAAIFSPLDVVDNAYFAAGADEARKGCAGAEVPRRFLCVARFMAKKNLGRLLVAYAGYRAQAGAAAWGLTLSGSGELDGALRHQAAGLGLAAHVEFAGFLQYPDLPAAYARAGALILASTSDQWGLVVNEAMAAGLPVLVSSGCGCAPDLVREGENGWTFDPHNTGVLQDCLGRMAAIDFPRWRGMGRRSREIVAAYTPEAFADALEQAGQIALAPPVQGGPSLSRALVGLLGWRDALKS